MDFILTPDTLDPRPDTETLVAAVLDLRTASATPRILDLGTGTGCILLAILKDWPQASGIGVDVNPGTVKAAADNAVRLGFASRAIFQKGSWADGLSETFDIIVSNPPYIAATELPGLAPEVTRFDPKLALIGGTDGLAAYRALIPSVRRRLAPKGRLFLEIGARQAESVTGLLTAGGFCVRGEHRDLNGVVRCLEAISA
jgi:release factor glutamine methyltransferase